MAKRMTALLLAICLATLTCAALATEPARTVRVGWVLRPGMTEYADGAYAGFNFDVLAEIARYTGWRYEFVVADLAAATDMLARGELDLLGSLLYSDERATAYDFPDLPYGHRYTILFAADQSPLKAYDYAAFDGTRIGSLAADVASRERLAHFAETCGFAYQSVEYESAEAFAAAVSDGEVDAGVVDAFMNEPGFRILAEFSPIPYYFATTKGNAEVLHALNRALWQINLNRPYMERELYDKHFGISFNPELTARDLALVEASRQNPIQVGVIPSSAPACYWDESKGQFAGISMELLDAVAKKTGLRFEYVPIDLSKGPPVAQMKQGALALAAGVIRTERFLSDDTLALSGVLMHDSLVMVGRKNDDFTDQPESRTIAYLEGFQVAAEYVASKFPGHKVKTYPTVDECFDAVANGSADAVAYSRTCANYLLHNPHYEALEVIQAYYCDVDTCVAGLAEQNGDLIAIINKGLAMLSDAERNGIIMDSTLSNPYRVTFRDMLYKYRIPLSVIALLLLAVIGVLTVLNSTTKRSRAKLQAVYRQEQQAREKESAALALAEQASAAKGSFMSRMSHEIRTPLNAVIGYNTIARNELSEAKTDEERRHATMSVMDCLLKSDVASRHLLTIINEVLDMSAIESGRIQIANERFDFKGLISSLTTIFYAQAKSKGVELDVLFDTACDEWLVGDSMRVNQVLTNLLSNAVKFTAANGNVTLRVHPQATADAVAIAFTVRDTGIGMTAEYLSHIWTPFEQADSSISRRFGGTGLGLSIAKTLVELMGGTIAVESEPGVGSTFRVDLTFGRTEQPAQTEAFDFQSVNALVVDDDASTCEYIKLLLTRCGARGSSVTSGADAVEAVRAAMRATPFTICLVDWHMPGMDGMETVRRIRAVAGAELPIIVITAYDFADIAKEAADAGVTTMLSKPLFQSSLLDLLASVGGRPAPAHAEKRAAVRFDGSRVLLAEDNKMNMEVSRRILTYAGLTVDAAWNGQEAVELFTGAPAGTYQAVLMDIHMPVMDGHQATIAIRASGHPDATTVPIIAMTADAFAENVAQALASGMNDHVSKPIESATLYETLRRYIPSAD